MVKALHVVGFVFMTSLGLLGPTINMIILTSIVHDKISQNKSDGSQQADLQKQQYKSQQVGFYLIGAVGLTKPTMIARTNNDGQLVKMDTNTGHHPIPDLQQYRSLMANNIDQLGQLDQLVHNQTDIIVDRFPFIDHHINDHHINDHHSNDHHINDHHINHNSYHSSDILYSVEIEKSGRTDETGVYRNPNSKEHLIKRVQKGDKVIDSLQKYLMYSMDQNKDRTAISYKKWDKDRDYQLMSYDKLLGNGLKVGQAIRTRGLEQVNGQQVDQDDLMEKQVRQQGLVGFYGKNELEGMVGDIGCQLNGVVSVWFDDGLDQNDIQYILQQTKLNSIFSTRDGLSSIVKMNKLSINNIVYQDISQKVDQQLVDDLEQKGYNMISYQELIESVDNDKNSLIEGMRDVNGSDIATILYSSGTTGDPKLVVVSQSNIVSVLAGLENQQYSLTNNDRHISYISLAHVLEKVWFYAMLTAGGNVGVYSGDPDRVQRDIEEFKPTLFGAFSKVYDMFKQQISGQFDKQNRIVKNIIKGSMKVGYQLQNKRNRFSNGLTRKVFKTVRDKFGGQIRMMYVGDVAISDDTVRFMRSMLGVGMVQSYGQIESIGTSFATNLKDSKLGHVGGPFTNIEFKIRSVPSLHYHVNSTVRQGELMLRGPSIFQGYYKDPAATQNIVDEDGWFHTGDIVTLNDNGSISIVGSIANIFKLCQGEYIVPEKVEKVLKDVSQISEIFVYGDPLKNDCVALVCLNPECQIDSNDLVSIISKFGKQNGLSDMEVPKRIYIIDKPFSEYYDCVTESFKFKRQNINKIFKEDIDRLYR